jgi:electron transport complex protein RnfG
MKDTIKYSLILFFICLIAGLLLSVVYAVTQPRIQQVKLQQQERAIRSVLPEAGKIQKVEKGDLVYHEALDNEGRLLGYIFIPEAKGYSSIIRAVVAVSPDAKIIAVKILEQNETPGIGTKITDEKFLQGFKGKTKDDSIDTITGATISSRALIKSIRETMQRFFP